MNYQITSIDKHSIEAVPPVIEPAEQTPVVLSPVNVPSEEPDSESESHYSTFAVFFSFDLTLTMSLQSLLIRGSDIA
jgi:hypothetical protein